MKDLFEKYNIKLTDKQLQKLQIFYSDVIEKNKVLNLTAITEERDFYIKHYIDSLLPAKYLQGKVLDIGTGAGFPGIPLKIFNENLNLYLLDSLNKRLVFLNEEIERLYLNNIFTIHARCEDYAKTKERESFDYVVSRAVAKLNTLCEYALPFLKIGGVFVAYKSGEVSEELENSKNAIKILGGELLEIKNFNIEDNNRTLIFIKKIKNTPNKYPRGQNKPKTSPI